MSYVTDVDVLEDFEFDDEPSPKPKTKLSAKAVKTVSEVKEQPGKLPKIDEVELYKLLKKSDTPQQTPKKKRGRPPKAKKEAPKQVEEKLEPLDEDEEIAQRRKLLMAINRYITNERFGKFLKEQGFKKTGLEKKSIVELTNYLKDIREAINYKDSGISLSNIEATLKLIERQIVYKSRGKMRVDGTVDDLWSDEQTLDDIEKFRLEYLSFARVSYKLRLPVTILKTGLMRHRKNVIEQRPVYGAPVEETKSAEQYSDLLEPEEQPKPKPKRRGRPPKKKPQPVEEEKKEDETDDEW